MPHGEVGGERKAIHDTLAHQAAIVDHAGDALIAITKSGMVTSWNPAAERIYHVLLCSDETVLRRAARTLTTVVNTLQEGVVVVDRNGWWMPTVNPAAR